MKILLIIIALIFSFTTLSAQTNQTEAKAAYLLAEESYGKGDYKTALRYLELTKKSLGSSNSKMLYLWIQTEIEISKTEPGNNEKILALIDEFEKLSDVNSFSEEKVLEITKIKLTLKTQLSDANEKAKEKLLSERAINAYFKNLDYPLGSSLADLKVKHPDFAKAIDKVDRNYEKRHIKKVQQGLKYYSYKGMDFIFHQDILFNISIKLFEYSGPDSIVKGKSEFNFFLDDFILKYGYISKPIITEDKISNKYSERYFLSASGKFLVLLYETDANICRSTIIVANR